MARTGERVDAEQLLERYRDRSATKSNDVLLQHEDALSLLRECREQGIVILGMDFYRRDGKSIVPLLNSADYSSLATLPNASMLTAESAERLIRVAFPDNANLVSFVLQ